jgi:hypothetical protein
MARRASLLATACSLLYLIKIAVKFNTLARFGFVNAKFATQAHSRQILVVDSVEVNGVALGLAGLAAVRLCKLYQACPPDHKDKTDTSGPDVVDNAEFHCITSKPFSVVIFLPSQIANQTKWTAQRHVAP